MEKLLFIDALNYTTWYVPYHQLSSAHPYSFPLLTSPLERRVCCLHTPLLHYTYPLSNFLNINFSICSFFPIRKEWVNPKVAFNKIQRFVDLLRRDGWQLEVFLDAAAHSDEAKEISSIQLGRERCGGER